jgi:hypothetical protein
VTPAQAIEAGRVIAARAVASNGSISSEIMRQISDGIRSGSIPESMNADVLRGADEFLNDLAYDVARATDAIDHAVRQHAAATNAAPVST